MSTLKKIKEKQAKLKDSKEKLAKHKPEMLLIGCVDARKDPIADLGIPKGKVLILRNVAAIVHPESEGRLTESAALAFAVREMKVKDVVIMGHTDCGGIHAAISGSESYSLRDYLYPIKAMCDRVMKETDDLEEQRWLLEQAAVRYSVSSLRTYDYIKEAESKKKLKLHGWILDITTGKIHVLDHKNGKFKPMVK